MSNVKFRKFMAGMCAAAMCTTVMAVSPAVAFADDITETTLTDTNQDGNTTVKAEVIKNMNEPTYEVVIPKTVNFGQIQQPKTDQENYASTTITVRCENAQNLEQGQVVAVLVKDSTARTEDDPFKLTNNMGNELQYEMFDSKEKSIQDSSWFENGYIFGLFSGGGQQATDTLRLNRAQLYDKDLTTWGGEYTGTLNFHARVGGINDVQ